MKFDITLNAVKFMRTILSTDGGPGSGFHVVLEPDGRHGLAAAVSIKDAPEPGDQVIDRSGIRFFLPADSRLLLDGATIDYADFAGEVGLVFYDGRAAGTCALH